VARERGKRREEENKGWFVANSIEKLSQPHRKEEEITLNTAGLKRMRKTIGEDERGEGVDAENRRGQTRNKKG